MAEDCFDGIPVEDVKMCPNEEVQAGLSPVVYFIPKAFLDYNSIVLPSKPFANLAAAATVVADIAPLADKVFIKLDLQVDLNSASTALVGNRGSKKDQTSLNIFIPGTRAKVLAFKKLYKNVPGIYLVKDYNGKTFMIGTYLAPAYIDNLEVTTGQGNEDNNGGTGTIMSNSNLYEYTGIIVVDTGEVAPKSLVVTPGSGVFWTKDFPLRLAAEVLPEGASQEVIWSVAFYEGDGKVVVDESGIVSILGLVAGIAKITCAAAGDELVQDTINIEIG